MPESAIIQFSRELDAELERHVPPDLRGNRKTALRLHYVCREWLRERGKHDQQRKPEAETKSA